MAGGIKTPWTELERVTQAWRLSVSEAPETDLATVKELQTQARILFPGETDPFGGAEDDLLRMYIQAASQEVDAPLGWLGRSLITRTLRLSLDRPPPTVVRLPGIPVQSITQVAYTDPDGVEVIVLEAAMEAAGYRSDLGDTGLPALLWNSDPGWPTTEDRPGSIRIDYVAGYGTSEKDVPAAIRRYILALAAEMYRDREASSMAPVATLQHVERSLDNYRVRMI